MKATIYLHASKESNWDLGEKLGLRGLPLIYFSHALTEVKCDVEVSPDGECKLIAVDGRSLA